MYCFNVCVTGYLINHLCLRLEIDGVWEIYLSDAEPFGGSADSGSINESGPNVFIKPN